MTDEYAVQELSFEEKLQLVTGQTLWLLNPHADLPALTLSDGPHGIRKPLKELALQDSFPATCFPTASALACSFDTDLLKTVGRALQRECLYYNVSVLLGPGLNLKRHAAGGRNFEYFSEDPLVSGRLAAAYVLGVQESGKIAACVKHFCVNNQESHRFVVDAIVDPRSCRELYYRQFQYAIQGSNPATLMCAYNKLNGVFCSEHEELYKILRSEWNYDGVVMTDWGATNNRAAGIHQSVDLEMPGSHGAHRRVVARAIENGELKPEELDDCCRRMLRLMHKYRYAYDCKEPPVDFEAQHELAYQAALQCIVLLQNRDSLLPLAPKTTKVAVIGEFAKNQPRYQGMGSSRVTPYRIATVMEEIGRHTDHVTYARGYDADDDDEDAIAQHLIDEAVGVAKGADAVLLCVGLPEIMESEGFDRSTLCLQAQHQALVEQVCKANSNVIVFLANGGTVQIPDHFLNAKAILEGYLLGQAGGKALVDVVFGVESPSGKLSETMPIDAKDVPSDQYFPGTRHAVEYREGLDVGYRYFDTANIAVRFPFGHGLSYTTFAYSNLSLHVESDTETKKKVTMSFDIQNTGSVRGKEVAQCYVHDVEASVYRPTHELRDFTKVALEPGESKRVTFILDENAFNLWDIGVDEWIVEPGAFEIQIGSSSRDIRLRQTIELKTGKSPSALAKHSYPPRVQDYSQQVDDETFASRFGNDREKVLTGIQQRASLKGSGIDHEFHYNTLLKEIASSRLLGRLLMHVVLKEASREVKPGPFQKRQLRMVQANVENLPLRALVLFSSGGLSFEALDLMIAIMNRKILLSLTLFCKFLAAVTTDTASDMFPRR